MNRLFRHLHRWKCKNAAQKLALDALRSLGGGDQDRGGVFLWHVEQYLRGVAAPEREFRDYTNQVLYPVENWGGAARLARKWYWRTVESLGGRHWSEAVYEAGVLARYASFSFSPLRTGHDERGLVLRAPVEWCVSRLYDDLMRTAVERISIPIPLGEDWLEQLITSGAKEAHGHLNLVTSRFDFDEVINRPAALDDELRTVFASLLRRTAASVGAILARAIDDSGVELPRYPIGAAGLFAQPSLPLFWATRTQSQIAERRTIRAMYREFCVAGQIEATLPEDARAVRDAFELEVLKRTPRNRERDSAKHASNENSPSRADRPSALQRAMVVPPRPHDALTPASPIAAVWSIDPKLAARLASAGIETVGQLLAAKPGEIASVLHPEATATDVTAWQDEARLRCETAALAPTDAQLLVACGVTGCDDLSALSPVELWDLITPVAESPDGRRLLRGGPAPDLDAVTHWIEAAKGARKAA